MESSPSPALAKLVRLVQASSVELAPKLAPDDEWPPALFVETQEGANLFIEGFPTFRNEAERREMFEVALPRLLTRLGAARAALVMGGYAVRLNADSPTFERDRVVVGIMSPLRHPDRDEVLVINAREAGSGEKLVSMAVVHRTPDASPTLGEWIDSAAFEEIPLGDAPRSDR